MEELSLPGHRFGIVSDTHDELVDWSPTLVALKALWGDIDGIFHCGDLTTVAAIDSLASIAPVFASRSDGDPPPRPPHLADGPRRFAIGGVRVGLVFSLGQRATDKETIDDIFTSMVDVCIHGGTHEPSITERDRILFVNPGSPTLAQRQTVALLTITGGGTAAQLLDVP